MENQNNPVAKAIIDNIFGNGAGAEKVTDVRCEICNLSVSGACVLVEHSAGKKHKRKRHLLAMTHKRTYKQGGGFFCEMCNVSNDKIVEFENHLETTQHLAELAKKAVKDETTKPNLPTVIGEVVGVVKAISGNFNCDICGISTTSQTCFDAHIISKKHKRKLTQDGGGYGGKRLKFGPNMSRNDLKNQYQGNFVPAGNLTNETIVKSITESGSVTTYYCKKCECKMTSKAQYDIHISSNRHKFAEESNVTAATIANVAPEILQNSIPGIAAANSGAPANRNANFTPRGGRRPFQKHQYGIHYPNQQYQQKQQQQQQQQALPADPNSVGDYYSNYQNHYFNANSNYGYGYDPKMFNEAYYGFNPAAGGSGGGNNPQGYQGY